MLVLLMVLSVAACKSEDAKNDANTSGDVTQSGSKKNNLTQKGHRVNSTDTTNSELMIDDEAESTSDGAESEIRDTDIADKMDDYGN